MLSALFATLGAAATANAQDLIRDGNFGGGIYCIRAPCDGGTLDPTPVYDSGAGVTGVPRDGETLSIAVGSWTSSYSLSYEYQISRCPYGDSPDAVGTGCTLATASTWYGFTTLTYTLVVADVGSTVYVRVGAVTSNSDVGYSPWFSAGSVRPQNTALPSVSGTVARGQSLIAATGSWNDVTGLSYVYQWQRSTTDGLDWEDLIGNGATTATYTVQSADLGARMRVRVGASKSGGAAEYAYAAALVPPKATSSPFITGTERVGNTLTATSGSWESVTTLAYQWKRCPATNTDVDTPTVCTNIGADQTTYTLSSADVGKLIGLIVTGTNDDGATPATATVGQGAGLAAAEPLSGEILDTPINTATPTAPSGTAQDGVILFASSGSWSPGGTTVSYAWYRCSAASTSTADDCVLILGEVGDAYITGPDDVGSRIGTKVTGDWAGASLTVDTALTDVIAPLSTEAPALSGTVASGQTVTATDGDWNGVSDLTLSYRWQIRSTSGDSWSTIDGATSAGYAVQDADLGRQLRAEVTASKNGSATVVATTSALTPPRKSGTPSIAGIVAIDQTLSVTGLSWSPAASTVSYQWLRDGSSIGSATASTYTLRAADRGTRVSVLVTGQNASGATPVAITGVDLPALPVAVTPILTGTAKNGATLTLTPASWTGATSSSGQWVRCPAAASEATDPSCANLDATTTYIASADDVGMAIGYVASAANAAGAATSATLSAIIAPANTAAPAISGTARDGATLTVDDGIWDGTTGLSFDYRWLRNGTPIADATEADYIATADDVGAELSVEVTAAKNGSAGTTVTVALGDTIAPQGTAVPVITGTAKDGATLSVSTGSWNGVDGLTFSYQWLRDGSPIAEATSASYVLQAADAGALIGVRVGATINGSAVTTQEAVSHGPIALRNTAVPAVTGNPISGQQLSASTGTWNGVAPTALDYQWLRDGTPIATATAATYATTVDDVGAQLSVTVSATINASASTTAVSAVTGPIAPINTAVPTVLGGSQIGDTLTVNAGDWDGVTALSRSYQWLRNDTSIDGATSTTYTLTADDLGAEIGVREQVSKNGSAMQIAVSATRLAGVPTNDVAPSLTGTVTEGTEVAGTLGEWVGIELANTVTWQRRASGAESWTDLPLPVDPLVYPIGADDVGQQLRMCVEVVNRAGTASACSTALAPPRPPGVPEISGARSRGSVLSVADVAWIGQVDTVTYQWLRDGTPISDATAADYTLISADRGHQLSVRVTATGPDGTTALQADAGSWTDADALPAAPTVDPVPSGRSTLAIVSFTAAEPDGLLQCQLNGGSWSTCSSPLVLTGLTPATYTLAVRQIDDAGNIGPANTTDWIVRAAPVPAPAPAPAPIPVAPSPAPDTTSPDSTPPGKNNSGTTKTPTTSTTQAPGTAAPKWKTYEGGPTIVSTRKTYRRGEEGAVLQLKVKTSAKLIKVLWATGAEPPAPSGRFWQRPYAASFRVNPKTRWVRVKDAKGLWSVWTAVR